MTVCDIVKMGNPVLTHVADPVADPKAPEIRDLVEDMRDSLAAVGGVGLAAPQIGVPLRVILFEVPGDRLTQEDGEESVGIQETVLINPELSFPTNEIVNGWEGCLSVPGWRGLVPRYSELFYSGYDLQGNKIECQATGFHARVVQHEYDHLIGRLYPTRMTDLGNLVYESEWKNFIEDQQSRKTESQENDNGH